MQSIESLIEQLRELGYDVFLARMGKGERVHAKPRPGTKIKPQTAARALLDLERRQDEAVAYMHAQQREEIASRIESG